MTGHDYILTKQTEWANNRGIALTGSQDERGRPAYVRELSENLFQPLSPETLAAFKSGDGQELGQPGSPGKMQAVLGRNYAAHRE